MKRIIIFLLCAMSLTSCGILTSGQLDAGYLASAAAKTLSAATISDAQIIQLSQQTVAQLDAQNTIDNGTYAKRLNNMMRRTE